jgi:glycosyltransferase involved in cell wall biosynthesis
MFTECYRPIQNGIVASIDALADVLRANGHRATVIAPRMPHYHDGDRDIVRVPSIPLPTSTAYRLTVPYFPNGRPALSIVHTHSPFVTGWLGLREARRARTPMVFTYHTQLEAYAHYAPFDARLTRRAATQLTRAYANAANAVIVPTRTMERRLRSIGVRARVVVVPSAVDVARFARGRRDDALRARFGVGPGDKMILTVGRLGREKNVELALEAFARLGDARAYFVIVGDGPHRASLERHARACGIASKTIFAREFARDALPDTYASSDVFVFTSHSETQGLVLVEALAARVPVVALDTPQTREVVAAGGSLVAGDAVAVAAGLRDALAGNIVDPRQSDVAARFDPAVLGGRIVELYRSLLAAAPEPGRDRSFAVGIT